MSPLGLPQDAVTKFFEALRYEERFYVYMGVTLALGLFLTIAASAHDGLCTQRPGDVSSCTPASRPFAIGDQASVNPP
jgi:hypothetical protein